MESVSGSIRRKYLKSPWLEAILMMAVLAASFIALNVISSKAALPAEGAMSSGEITGYLAIFFFISFAIAIISVMAGIGGGVIFTPIMLAFTNVDSLVIRATGLIVAMFSGLISTGIFLRKGLGNLKLTLILATSQGVGAFLGAQTAIYAYNYLGKQGEAWIRLLLGVMLTAISVYFLFGGKKLEWPEVNRIGRFTRWLRLTHTYYEDSEERVVTYRLKKAAWGMFGTFFVGIIGGFFGMGGGWAITPVQNLIMGVPMKVAAANSGIILGMVDCVAVWPYILTGAIFPLFVLPWLSGQVIGGYLGSLLLVKIKVTIIRFILIGIMFFTSFGLLTRGMEILKIIPPLSPTVSLLVFAVVIVFVGLSVIDSRKRQTNG